MDVSAALESLIHSNGRRGPVFFHSDLFRASFAAPRGLRREEALAYHADSILAACSGRPAISPTFNYDFGRSGVFSLRESPSQVGPLSESFRAMRAKWRSHVPFFSACGTGLAPSLHAGELEIDPFGPRSIFAWLEESDGSVLYYGAPFSASTILHRAEAEATSPYRYEKRFAGQIVDADGNARDARVRMHVRPLGRDLVYRWDKMLDDLARAGLVRKSDDPRLRFVFALDARPLMAFWRERLRADPLYALDEASRSWVARELDALGRAFRQNDFEKTEG